MPRVHQPLVVLGCCVLGCVAANAIAGTCSETEKPSPKQRVRMRNLAVRYYTTEPARKRLLDACALKKRHGTRGLAAADYLYNCDKQQQMFKQQESLHGTQATSNSGYREVYKQQSQTLTYRRFMSEYQQQGIPVVLAGMAERMLPSSGGLSIQQIRETCGAKPVVPMYPSGVPQWAGLGERGEMSLSEFIANGSSAGCGHSNI